MRRENQLGGGVSASQSGVKKATRKHSQGSGEDSEVRRAIHHWNEQNPLDRSKGYFMVREEKTPSVHKDYDGFCREMYTDFGNGEKLDPFEIYVRENKLNKRTEIWRVVGEYREWLENQSAAYCQEARQSAPEVREVPTLAPVATVAPVTTQEAEEPAEELDEHADIPASDLDLLLHGERDSDLLHRAERDDAPGRARTGNLAPLVQVVAHIAETRQSATDKALGLLGNGSPVARNGNFLDAGTVTRARDYLAEGRYKDARDAAEGFLYDAKVKRAILAEIAAEERSQAAPTRALHVAAD